MISALPSPFTSAIFTGKPVRSPVLAPVSTIPCEGVTKLARARLLSEEEPQIITTFPVLELYPYTIIAMSAFSSPLISPPNAKEIPV
jgi:hypothetical protein